MEQLIEAMKKVLADAFAFRLKAQYYHWNVEGSDFYEYHKFFGDLYEEVDDAIDSIAEHIRTLDAYAPGSFSRYLELTTIKDESTIPVAADMVSRLLGDNQIILANLKIARDLADSLGKNGIVNFLEDRLDTHEKHSWMLRSTVARK